MYNEVNTYLVLLYYSHITLHILHILQGLHSLHLLHTLHTLHMHHTQGHLERVPIEIFNKIFYAADVCYR